MEVRVLLHRKFQHVVELFDAVVHFCHVIDALILLFDALFLCSYDLFKFDHFLVDGQVVKLCKVQKLRRLWAVFLLLFCPCEHPNDLL